MNIPEPVENMFTIYSKSYCIYCTKLEVLLEDYFEQLNNSEIHEYRKINCDKYLEKEDDKKEFKEFIKKMSNVNPTTFPIVFYDKKFIGGFEEMQEYLKCKMMKFDEEF
jgi:glutaredoxin